MKTISMAAKEGIEAAAKVKELEADNKKLSEENVVLTKNFESERVRQTGWQTNFPKNNIWFTIVF